MIVIVTEQFLASVEAAAPASTSQEAPGSENNVIVCHRA